MYRHVLQVSPCLSDVYTLCAAILMPHCCTWWNVYGLCMVIPYAIAQTAQLFWTDLLLAQMIVLLPATYAAHRVHATLPLSYYLTTGLTLNCLAIGLPLCI